MALKDITMYEQYLYGCRFCPMCKPAAEVANITMLESHTTRARAMLIWRVAHGYAEYSSRDIEILYESTLDSLSESWCVNHYPVSEYLLIERAKIVEQGKAPELVKQVLQREAVNAAGVQGKILLLAGETTDLGEQDTLAPALDMLKTLRKEAVVAYASTGVVPYALGDMAQAKTQAERIVKLLHDSGSEQVIADGPQTLYALRYMYPQLEVQLPSNLTVLSLNDVLTENVKEGNVGKKVFFHDSRCACHLAEEKATDQVLPADFTGPEEELGKGAVYEAPRRILDTLGYTRTFSVWSRSLSKSAGTDDGLWLTYPYLAKKLAKQRLEQVKDTGAEMLVTDSILSASFLKKVAEEESADLEIKWLPELIEV